MLDSFKILIIQNPLCREKLGICREPSITWGTTFTVRLNVSNTGPQLEVTTIQTGTQRHTER